VKFIECSVGMGNPAVTSEPVSVSLIGSKSVAARLEELERIKFILSEQEYAKKRQEILVEV